jgi:hypothetical protein
MNQSKHVFVCFSSLVRDHGISEHEMVASRTNTFCTLTLIGCFLRHVQIDGISIYHQRYIYTFDCNKLRSKFFCTENSEATLATGTSGMTKGTHACLQAPQHQKERALGVYLFSREKTGLNDFFSQHGMSKIRQMERRPAGISLEAHDGCAHSLAACQAKKYSYVADAWC